ncbi:MAG: cyclic nucleotide-binding domain-containing protein [Oligoflexia bacterium]|nr:cyclic nucleotide-binding domain-containing protein [Oligoflexia bacterium]
MGTPALQQLKGNIVNYSHGAIIVHENELSRKMYIVVKGKVRVYKSYMGSKITLAILGVGEIFGELSFFDGVARSASVEALSDVSLAVIDGDKSVKDIEALPKWVIPVMKTVFQRFREADQKILTLENMYEFQKKNFKMDKVAQTIYNELQRFLKTTKILYSKMKAQSLTVSSVTLYKDLDDILGKRVINLRKYWKSLGEYNFFDSLKEIENKTLELHLDLLSDFILYVEKEINDERFLLLNHSSLNILKRIISYNKTITDNSSLNENGEQRKKIDINKEFLQECRDSTESNQENENMIEINSDDLDLQSIPFVDLGLSELNKHKIIVFKADILIVNMDVILKNFIHQSFLKSFDHTIFSSE